MSGEPLRDHGSVNLQAEASNAAQAAQAAGQQAAQNATAAATQEAASQAMHQAGRVLRLGASEVRLFIVSNHFSIHMLSFIGGLVLLAVSLLGMLSVLSILVNPLAYLKNVYEVLFAVVICVIDGPGDRLPTLKLKLLTYASFLHNNTGRAIFYLFLACLEGEQTEWYRVVVGWYFLFIGIAHGILQCWQSGRAQRNSHEQVDTAPTGGEYAQA